MRIVDESRWRPPLPGLKQQLLDVCKGQEFGEGVWSTVVRFRFGLCCAQQALQINQLDLWTGQRVAMRLAAERHRARGWAPGSWQWAPWWQQMGGDALLPSRLKQFFENCSSLLRRGLQKVATALCLGSLSHDSHLLNSTTCH